MYKDLKDLNLDNFFIGTYTDDGSAQIFQIQKVKVIFIYTKEITAPYCNKILIERDETFDRYRKCPFQLELPKNNQEMDKLIRYIGFMLTKNGKHFSNNYNFVYDYNYPIF